MRPTGIFRILGRRRAALWRLSAAPIALLLAVLAAGGCRQSRSASDDISVRTSLSPQPVRVGLETISIQIADRSAHALTHASVTVEADMAHPGMNPQFAAARESAPGTYTAQVDFNMRGDWILLSHIQLPGGRRLEERLNLGAVGSGQ